VSELFQAKLSYVRIIMILLSNAAALLFGNAVDKSINIANGRSIIIGSVAHGRVALLLGRNQFSPTR